MERVKRTQLQRLTNLLPTQSGNSGKFLSTDGSNPAWAVADALPPQTGNAGKFPITDGSAASWDNVPSAPTGHSTHSLVLTARETSIQSQGGG